MYFSEIVYPAESPLTLALGITFCFMSFGTDHHDIVLVQQTNATGQVVPVDTHEAHHIALELQPGMTTPQFAERLKQRGIPIFYGPVLHRKGPYGDGGAGGNLAVYFSDPDGHQIEVFSGMDPF